MTIEQSLVSACPDWSSDGPATREGSFRDSVAAAYRLVEQAAGNHAVRSEECCQWHKAMFARHVPLDYYAGNYRQVDPRRPCLNVNVEVAGQPGEAAANVPDAMQLLFDQTGRPLANLRLLWSGLPPPERAKRVAIVLAYLVGRFIQVHPFVNGNGRTSRLLWVWGLLRFGVPPQVRIRTHPENPDYDRVMAQAMSGDFVPLALFILTHLVAEPPDGAAPNM